MWRAYFIGVIKGPPAGAVEGKPGAYIVGHNDVRYLIDKAGRKRSMMQEDAPLDDLVNNVRTLLRE